MIVILNLNAVFEGESCFAFFDTEEKRFVDVGGEQVWKDWPDFKECAKDKVPDFSLFETVRASSMFYTKRTFPDDKS